MAAKSFTPAEWRDIMQRLEAAPQKYGFPERVYGSAVIGSFNIRKIGSVSARSKQTWNFLAHICRQFDLLAVQEVMDNLSGINQIMQLLGPEFGMIVSDRTGAFPGAAGLAERLAFIYRRAVVNRGEVVSDITYDRTKVLEIIAENLDKINEVMAPYSKALKAFEQGQRKKPKSPQLPVFLSFIRQPFCVSFKIVGFPGTKPYRFMAVNAHLMFGKPVDRRKEFDALMTWIIERVKQFDKTYYPNFVLLGDLNLDFNNPATDIKKIENHLKSFNNNVGEEVNVNFPFLDPYPGHTEPFKTNARLNQTFDQIGLFFREQGLPTHIDNKSMGKRPEGPDYGVFNFVELFRDTLGIRTPIDQMTREGKRELFSKFEHKVSDHMPIWLRLPLPAK